MTTKSLVDTIKIVITQNDTGSIATIKALYDYNTSNGSHSIVFKASDATLILNPAVLDTINNDSTEINLNIKNAMRNKDTITRDILRSIITKSKNISTGI